MMPKKVSSRHILFHAPGTGSQIIFDALTYCQIPFEVVELDYEETCKGKNKRLTKVNPLSRLPTLLLPDKSILTESGAILFYLNKVAPKAKLIPNQSSNDYQLFLRLFFIINSEIYPCFTFKDDPSEWVQSKSEHDYYANQIDIHRKELWKYFESLCSKTGPFALGKNFSALDLYIGTMTNWGPGWPWFESSVKRLAKIAKTSREKINAL